MLTPCPVAVRVGCTRNRDDITILAHIQNVLPSHYFSHKFRRITLSLVMKRAGCGVCVGSAAKDDGEKMIITLSTTTFSRPDVLPSA